MLRLDRKPEVWQAAFYALIAVYGTVILLTFTQYGITSDEAICASYGEDIIGWYRSFFKDRSVFEYRNTWLYGGVFNVAAHLASQALGLDVYDARHLCNGLVALLGVVAAYRLGHLLGGRRAGFLAALFLVLTPRYYGHGFNNGKDIPFAVFYLWSLYYLVRGAGGLPQIWKTGLAIGLTMAVRANGGILMAYLVLFYGLTHWRGGGHPIRDSVLPTVVTGAIAYGVMFLFWPWLQIHPFSGLWDGIRTFASFPEVHYTFFEGQYVGSDAIPRYYAPKWLLLSLPEFVMVGLVLLVICLGIDRESFWRLEGLQKGMVAFGGLFPLAYAVVLGTPLYDGIRQVLFGVLPLVVLSGVGVDRALKLWSGFFRRGVAVLVVGLLGLTFWEVVVLHPNEVVYFNRLFAGGVAGASQGYELDYWNQSYKHGIRWIEAHFDRHPSGRKWTIGSRYPNLPHMLDRDRFAYQAIPEHADFYLGNTRLDHHKRVPGEILHTVRVREIPLMYIIRPDSVYREDPFFAASPYMY